MGKKFLLFLFVGFISIALSEGVLKVTQRVFKIEVGSLAFLKFAESFEFHQRWLANRTAPELLPPPHFDSVLGWRNMDGLGDALFKGFRTPPFAETKSKKRIVLLGDSYMYSMWNQESDTIRAHLQDLLGPDYEVINLAVKGFGFDQIYLTATATAPRLSPDAIVFSFIGDDLRRSCTDFGFSYRKPKYEISDDGKLILTGVPVPTPRETHDFHEPSVMKLGDALLFFSLKSSLFRLMVEAVNRPSFNRCLSDMHIAFVKNAIERTSPKTRLLFAHLDGKLPRKFKTELPKTGAEILSMPQIVNTLSKELKLEIKYHTDGHPMPSLAAIYAHAIARTLKQGGSNSVRTTSR